MHSHAPFQADQGRHSAAPFEFLHSLRSVSPETLTDAITDGFFNAIVALLPPHLQAQAEASDALDDLIAEHASRLARAVLANGASACTRAAPARSKPTLEQVERLWDRFWSSHPTHEDQFDARAEFFRLMLRRLAEADFERIFFEGHEACCAAWRMGVAKAKSAFWWLKKDGWVDRYRGRDGKDIIGESERCRRAQERRTQPAVVKQVAAALAMPTEPKTSVAEDYAAALAAGKPRNSSIENYLRSTGQPVPSGNSRTNT